MDKKLDQSPLIIKRLKSKPNNLKHSSQHMHSSIDDSDESAKINLLKNRTPILVREESSEGDTYVPLPPLDLFDGIGVEEANIHAAFRRKTYQFS
jgi:hypothetical protein